MTYLNEFTERPLRHSPQEPQNKPRWWEACGEICHIFDAQALKWKVCRVFSHKIFAVLFESHTK